MKRKRKWGDRSDAVWLKDLPPLNRIMPGIMPNRADNEAYINVARSLVGSSRIRKLGLRMSTVIR